MNGVISTFTPEWRSIFQTRYGNPPSNVNDAFRRRATLSIFPCTCAPPSRGRSRLRSLRRTWIAIAPWRGELPALRSSQRVREPPKLGRRARVDARCAPGARSEARPRRSAASPASTSSRCRTPPAARAHLRRKCATASPRRGPRARGPLRRPRTAARTAARTGPTGRSETSAPCRARTRRATRPRTSRARCVPRRAFRGSRRSAQAAGWRTRAGRVRIRGAVIVDQHVEIDDAARIVVRAAARAVEKDGERVRSESLAQALAERDDGARRRQRQVGRDRIVERRIHRSVTNSAVPPASSVSGTPGVGEKSSPSTKNGVSSPMSTDARCGFRIRSPA